MSGVVGEFGVRVTVTNFRSLTKLNLQTPENSQNQELNPRRRVASAPKTVNGNPGPSCRASRALLEVASACQDGRLGGDSKGEAYQLP